VLALNRDVVLSARVFVVGVVRSSLVLRFVLFGLAWWAGVLGWLGAGELSPKGGSFGVPLRGKCSVVLLLCCPKVGRKEGERMSRESRRVKQENSLITKDLRAKRRLWPPFLFPACRSGCLGIGATIPSVVRAASQWSDRGEPSAHWRGWESRSIWAVFRGAVAISRIAV